MKQTLLIIGASALAIAAPSYAKPGNGHGPGYGKGNNPGMSHAHTPGMVHSNQGMGTTYGYGNGGCPPGLAKKAVPCVPPGQAKKLYGVGQQISGNQALLGYNQLPYGVRSAYGQQLNPYGRYMYDNNYVYGVDPRTMVVTQVLNSVLGRR